MRRRFNSSLNGYTFIAFRFGVSRFCFPIFNNPFYFLDDIKIYLECFIKQPFYKFLIAFVTFGMGWAGLNCKFCEHIYHKISKHF